MSTSYTSPNSYASYKPPVSYGVSATLNTGVTGSVGVSATASTQAKGSYTNSYIAPVNTAKSYLANQTSPTSVGSTLVSSTYQPYTPSPITANSPYAAYLPKTNLTPHSVDYVAPIKANENKNLFEYSFKKGGQIKTYEQLAKYLDETGKTYRDADFPTNMASLAGNNKRKQKTWAKYVWRSPDEFYGEGKHKVFTIPENSNKSEKDPELAKKKAKQLEKSLEGVDLKEYLPDYNIRTQDDIKYVKDLMSNIDAADIKQRALGDCYFLSTLAALTEYPLRVLRLFAHPDSTPHGCYLVKVCDMGEWKEIVVDDLFPCKTENSGPVFTIGNDNELWVLLLEKAWAKIYGSYASIEAGLTREALHDLTGAPTEYFNIQPEARCPENEDAWAALMNGEKNNYIMTAGSDDLSGDGQDNITKIGLVGSHAYSLLSCHEVTHPNRGRVRLVKLRNPWGKGEWTGDWGDNSNLWTPQLKKELEIVDADDGEFFIQWEDFCKYFSDVQVCRCHDDYHYSSFKLTKTNPKHATYVRFTLPEDGYYYFTINQKSKRFFPAGYQYGDVCLIVGKEDNGNYEYVEGIKKNDREVWTNINNVLKKGTYVAYIKYSSTDKDAEDITFSVYGKGKAGNYQVANKTSCPQFLEKVYTDKAIKSGKLETYEKDGEPRAFKKTELTDDGFGYFFYWNQGNSTLNSETVFKVKSGVNLRKPLSGNSFKVTVKPGEKKIVLTKVAFFGSSNQSVHERVTFEKSPEEWINDAKNNGQREQRQIPAINLYTLRHATGAFLLYENRSNQILEETIKFTFTNCKIEDKPYDNSVKVVLLPNQVKEIKLKKAAENWDFKASSTFVVKNA